TARWVADALVEALAIRPGRAPARPTTLPRPWHAKTSLSAVLPGAGPVALPGLVPTWRLAGTARAPQVGRMR
ncbi:MAG TPA: hypothetical protein VIL40_00040, partial [Thermaerobacter sp.]